MRQRPSRIDQTPEKFVQALIILCEIGDLGPEVFGKEDPEIDSVDRE